MTRGWTRQDKAAETYRCFSTVLSEHGEFIAAVSAPHHRRMHYKTLIYRMLAAEGRDFGGWWRGFSRGALKPWIATFTLLLIGRVGTAQLLGAAKRFGVLRRYG